MKLQLFDVYGADGVAHYNATVFLFQMLKERDPTTAISHEKMPTFEEHKSFVDRHPYVGWYLIDDGKQLLGSIYLTERGEIAVYVKAYVRRMGVATWAVNELMRIHGKRRYFMNIHPNNEGADMLRMTLGFLRPIQTTYELDTREPTE